MHQKLGTRKLIKVHLKHLCKIGNLGCFQPGVIKILVTLQLTQGIESK